MDCLSPGGQLALDAPLSPSAMYCMRDNDFKNAVKGGSGMNDQLSPRSDGGNQIISYCVCGLPKAYENETCDQCDGKNSIHIEGKIIKKQKKGG